MAQFSSGHPSTPTEFWRNPAKRAYLYQAIVFLLLLAAGFRIFQNTLANMAKRGISSGFGFLAEEAGFGITEAPPIPRLEGGFPIFIGALFFGLLAVYLLSRWRQSQGKTLGESGWLVLLTMVLIFLVPGLVIHLSRGTLQSEPYTEASSYGTALVVGMLNTIKISILGCILSTVIGVFVGIARLSTNFLARTLAMVYVEILRNIPVLLQIFFWYFAVLQTLPTVRESFNWADVLILNNRGIFLPDPEPTVWFPLYMALMFGVLLGMVFLVRHARRERDRIGRQVPVLLPSLGLLFGVPGLAWLTVGAPVTLTFPVLEGFNFQGGISMSPEFAALLFGLTIYTSALTAEIVRGGIQSVPLGQMEVARAMGLKTWAAMRLVILPQALRVIVPPMTSQFLNLTKNSSLGVAVAYPELVAVGGTAINQSGQAVEIIALTMAVYLTISLLISLFMNWYNARVKLVER